MSSKDLCNKRWSLTHDATGKQWDFDLGPGEKTSGHCGHAIERDGRTWVPFSSFSLSTHEILLFPTMCSCHNVLLIND